MSPHPLPRYQADKVIAQRWLAQPNDVAKPTMTAMTMGGNWCITLADEMIGDQPMRPSEGTHIIADFVDEQIAKAIVAEHNKLLEQQ